MRDRFISVAVSREPEPPAFRTAPPRRELEEITGIGPTYARRLRDGGFKVASDLLNASAKDIAGVAGVSETRAGDWIKQVHQFS
jgi:polyhydroxyalkanoate synthase